MVLSERPPDSEQNLRWLAWERKNRREDRMAEKRVKLVFGVVGVILLILIGRALTELRGRPSLVEKGSTVACGQTTGAFRYWLESGGFKPA